MVQDARTPLEKVLWEHIGPPLYYCAECMRAVNVTVQEGAEPIIKRKCEHDGQIIAPRKAIVTGKGGMSLATRINVAWMQAKAAATGRSA